MRLQKQAIVYTLGTSTRGSEEFLHLLRNNAIEMVVHIIDDKRSWVPSWG